MKPTQPGSGSQPRVPDKREQARQQNPQRAGPRDATRENAKNPQRARQRDEETDPGEPGPAS